MLLSQPFDNCNFTTPVVAWGQAVYWTVYSGLIPCFFFLATTSRLVSVMAFYIQAKQESAYMFQIFVAIVEAFEACSFSFYIATRYFLCGLGRWGQIWFMKCYVCMFVDAHFSNTLQMTAMFCSVLMALCMTLDRIYALAKPMRYNKVKNRARQQRAIFAFVIAFSFFCTFFVGFYFNTWWDEERQVYSNAVNKPWRTVLLSLIEARTWLMLALAIVLVMADIALAAIYRHRMKNRAKVASNRNPEVEAAEMQKVRMLFWMTFIQSALNILAAGSEFAYQLISWLCVVFELGDVDCICELLAPFVDGFHALAVMLDFYLMFALMPSFRRMIISGVRHFLKMGSTTSVKQISIGSGGGGRGRAGSSSKNEC